MRGSQLPPVVRDLAFLTTGLGVFVWEALHDARPVPMAFATLLALGPAAIAAYWSRASVPTRDSGPSVSPGPSSPSSSPPPLPSAAGGEP